MAANQQYQQPASQMQPGQPRIQGQAQINASVFDTFSTSLRNNVVRGAQSLVNSWSDCAYVIRYSRYTSYVITTLLIFVLLSLVFNWGPAVAMTLSVIAVICAAFQSYLVSQESCFKIFSNAAG